MYIRSLFFPNNSLGLLISFLFFTLTIYFILRLNALGGTHVLSSNFSQIDNPLVNTNSDNRIIYAVILLFDYIINIICPYRVSLDNSYSAIIPLKSDLTFLLIIKVISIIFLFCLGLISFLRKWEIGYFILWFFISFSLSCNIFFPINTIYSESLAYVPSIGIIGAYTGIFTSIPYKALKVSSIAFYTALLSIITMRSVPIWSSSKSLSHYNSINSPNSVNQM